MKNATVKGMVVKAMMAGLAAGAFMFVSPVKAQAQGFAVGVQVGHPYYVYDRDDYRQRDEDRQRDYYRQRDEFRQREEFREREQREEFERRQAYLRHEEWEHAQRFDRPYGYR